MQYSDNDHTFAICAYGKSPYLSDCVESLLKQADAGNIIITTSSSDQSIREVSEKYHIKLYVRDGESNIADDWNYAYQMASTALVTIAHQDDIYLPEYREQIINAINRSRRPLIAFSDYMELREGKEVSDNRNLKIKRRMLSPLCSSHRWSSIRTRRHILAFGNAICCPSVTYVKAYLQTPVFQKGLKSNLDWETWERISRQTGDFVYCNQKLMEHRIHQESTTSALISEDKRSDEDYAIFRRFWPAPIAGMLTKMYSESEKSNELQP